ncbi:MAG TPA: sulfotransferase [Acidimicrobiia bacterium]|nr:sulfotransferase [Acidimicrobiia bacterium]
MPERPPLTSRARDALRERLSFSTRRRIAMARVSLRRPTSRWRALPDLLVIGVQRGGTSSLYRYLGAHPQVVPSLRKEVEFFTRRYTEGAGWYLAHFPLRRRGTITFEADPYYMFHPLAAGRAAALVPGARLVVMLRDPVKRAFSHWQHNRRLGVEPLEFAAALEAEPERLAGEEERMMADPGYDPWNHNMLSYAGRGRYAIQLKKWLEHYPEEHLLVIRSEDFYTDTPAALDLVVSFLQLEPWRPPEFANWSYSRSGGPPKEKIDTEIATALAETFAADNRELEAMLGWDAKWT